MITITKIATIDESTYNHVNCPQCNSKIAWKPKGAKVHIFRFSAKVSGRMEALAVTCLRCKSNYLMSFESEETDN